MILNRYSCIRWLFSCLIFFSCKSSTNVEYISVAEQQVFQQKKLRQKIWLLENLQVIESCVRSGDLIVREGNDFTSQSLRQLNQKNKTYSHIGILSKENDSIVVYHIMGGEWNPDANIIREPLVNFISPSINNQFAVYRLDIRDDKKKQIVKNAVDLRKKDVRFDMDFDLKTADRMYCAEYVYHCVNPVLPPKSISTSQLNNFQFVGVDDIFLIPEANRVVAADLINTNLWIANQ